jgi:hypothetical protein
MKKFLFTMVSFILIITGCSSFSNNEKYDTAFADFYRRTETAHFFSNLVTSTYASTWANAIDNGSDFSVEVNAEITDNQNIIDAINKIKKDLSKQMKIMSEASKKNSEEYGEIYEESKKLYSTMSEMIEQANSPSGTLISFNSTIKELDQKYTSQRDMVETLLTEEMKKINKKKEKELKEEEKDKHETK